VKISAVIFFLVFVLYQATAISGFLLFGQETVGDILNNFPDDDIPAIIARIALSVIVISCYPLAFNSLRASTIGIFPSEYQDLFNPPLRNEAYSNLNSNEESRNNSFDLYLPLGNSQTMDSKWGNLRKDLPHFILTTALISLSVIIAILVPEVEVILGYKGAIGGSFLILILPALAYYQLTKREGKTVALNDESVNRSLLYAQNPDENIKDSPTSSSQHLRLLVLCMPVIGICILVLGTLSTAGIIGT
jgi:amino acid permease